MSTATTTEQTLPVIAGNPSLKTNGAGHKRRDLSTSIVHADEELYQKQLAEKGGKEDMWQGGDMFV
jgi:hypothetical protein